MSPERPAPGDPPGRPQDRPFVVECPPGKYAHCQCRASARYPYCDGTHRRIAGDVQPIKVVLDETRTVAWCACGRSGTMPFCDGSHAQRASESGRR